MLLWTLCLFFVMPLLIDAVGIKVQYSIYPALGIAFDDPLSRVLTAVAALIAILMVTHALRVAERRELKKPQRLRVRVKSYRWWSFPVIFLPLALVFLAPDPSAYKTFAAPFVLRNLGETFASQASVAARHNVYVTWSTYLSCIAFALWISGRRSAWVWPLAPLVAFMNFWINGKRNIIAIFILTLVFVLASEKPLDRIRLKGGAALMIGAFALLTGISVWYQANYRPLVALTGKATETFMVDFGRLDVTRLAIAGHTSLGLRRPLEYPFQSLVLDVEAIAPRIGSGKSETITYANRVTSIAANARIQRLEGSITTSAISESIDNFGLVGIFIGPGILVAMTMISLYGGDPTLRLVGALSASLLAVVHALAVLPILIFFILRLIVVRKNDRYLGTSLRSAPRPIQRSGSYIEPSDNNARGTGD